MSGIGAARAAIALSAAAVGGAVAAADWSLTGFASARTEAITESGGEDPDSGARVTGDLGFALTAQTPTTRLTFEPAARLLLSTLDGDGGGGAPLPRLRGVLAHAVDPRLSLTASASVVPDFVEESQFEDSGRRGSGEALQITAQGRAGAAYRVDPRQTLSLGAFARLRTFTEEDPGLSDSTSWGVDGGWTRALTPRSEASLSPSLTVFSSDGEDGEDGETLSLQLGFSHLATPRLTVDASIGPAVTRSARPGEDRSTDVSGVGRFGLRYRAPNADYDLQLTQGVEQNADGAPENRTTFRAGVSARLTPVIRGGLDATAGYQTPFGGDDSDRTFFSLTPQLSWDATKDWSLSVGYRFRAADRDEVETSHAVFFQVSRDLSLLP